MVRIATPRVQFGSDQAAALTVTPQADGVGSVVLDYLISSSVDRFPSTHTTESTSPPELLDVVPGFQALVLPFPDEVMPTGLAWRRDGRLVFTSLKGRVWQACDRDGDGVEDDMTELGVELSAPYGVAIANLADGGEAIDVVDKTAAIRLYDADDDGRAERVETLASGWGHSTDYHGWVVGLPRDEDGNYYVAVSQREGPTAHWRGRIVRLVPRTAAFDNPRRFQVDPLAMGFRFPLGIARSKAGALVATDNQGNYTPFNELNYVVQGGHYGFISEQDAAEVSARPTIPPSLAIPHPWTRSVNGICFLETPPEVRARLGRSLFGAFEGHLIGCEYDTRRLIRMSLQRVGDVWQGAAYPLSVPPPEGMRTFRGPVVCAVSPNGDVYVGSIRDSAWGSGNNTGEIVRMRFQPEELPTGIAEVTASSGGFQIDFTAPVDRQRAADANNYAIESYRRTATPAYGGPDEDRRREQIVKAVVSDDARRASIELHSLRTGYVYELHVKNLLGSGKTFFPSEAHFTLNAVPSRTNRRDTNTY
jgi:hypothetical protein